MDKNTLFINFLTKLQNNDNKLLIESVKKGFVLCESSNRITVKVTFDNGNSLVTDINTDIEGAKKYYLGKTFNLGYSDDQEDNLAKAIRVDEISAVNENNTGTLSAPIYDEDPIIPNALEVISNHPDAIAFDDKKELYDFYDNQRYFSASHSHCFYSKDEMNAARKTGKPDINSECDLVREVGRKLVMVWDNKNNIGYVIPAKKYINESINQKPKYVSAVLQLMDNDYDYADAVKEVLKNNPDLDKNHLEKELEDWC